MLNSITQIGHQDHQYIVDAGWGKLDANKYPVGDCHEMVIDSLNQLFLLTNNVRNNIIIYNLEGQFLGSWGTSYPGAHGLSIFKDNGVEYLLIADHDRHQIIKVTLEGEELMVINYPKETGCYSSKDQYLPTETAVAPNGDIYVTDGYGLQYVIQYDKFGNYIRYWGGLGNLNENFNCVHGIAIDDRCGAQKTLIITSRNDNSFKRFTLCGEYLETIYLPGSFVCRPVISGNYLYAAVFRSVTNMNLNSGYIIILDEQNKVVSAPGGTYPIYHDNKLIPLRQQENVFIHPHDVAVDSDGNIYVCQWKANNTYPIKLKKLKANNNSLN